MVPTLATAAARAGLAKWISSGTLRLSCAVHLLKSGESADYSAWQVMSGDFARHEGAGNEDEDWDVEPIDTDEPILASAATLRPAMPVK
jgi:hypothetical protein